MIPTARRDDCRARRVAKETRHVAVRESNKVAAAGRTTDRPGRRITSLSDIEGHGNGRCAAMMDNPANPGLNDEAAP
jgi:hypothetical protein